MYTGKEGGCDCGKVRYRLKSEPIVVNCCHCHACQRQTGAAFALNMLIETEHLELLGGEAERCDLETAGGAGQANYRCPQCRVSVWSAYNAAGDGLRFVRGGTLDDTSGLEPDLHIFTASKQPWIAIPEGAAQFEGFYSGKELKAAIGDERAGRFFAAVSR